jgi:predicted ATP-grasp superfamily ATP-dependent carboligase
MKKSPGVIVIGDHVQALGIIRSLGRHDLPVYLMHDKNLCIGRFSRYTKRFIKTPTLGNESEFVDFMVNFAEKNQVKDWILIPTNDKILEIVSKNKDLLEEYYKTPTPKWDIIKFALNKKLTYSIAKENGIPIPHTIYPKDIEELKAVMPEITFPVIVKPAVAHHFWYIVGSKMFQANSPEELIQKYLEASRILDSSEIMIQELIPGDLKLLYTFGSFFKEGKALATWTGKKIRQRPMDFGNCTFAISEWEPQLAEIGTRFLNAIDYYGISEIEIKKDCRDGVFKLIEMNARTWLWHSLAIRCGVDFPYLLYKDMVSKESTSVTSFRENIKWMHIYTDLGVLAKEALTGNMKLRDYISTLRGEKEFAVLSLDDPLPFIVETLTLPYLWITR